MQEILRRTGGRGVDLVLEAVGRDETISASIASVRKGGTVTLIGNISPQVKIPLQVVVSRQIRLQGSCASSGEYPEAMELLANGKIKVKPLITAVAPLSDGPAMVRPAARRRAKSDESRARSWRISFGWTMRALPPP